MGPLIPLRIRQLRKPTSSLSTEMRLLLVFLLVVPSVYSQVPAGLFISQNDVWDHW